MTLYPGHEAWLTHDYGGDGKKFGYRRRASAISSITA